MRQRARRLTRAFNGTTEEELWRRDEMIREIFGKVGTEVTIEPPFYCDCDCDCGSNIYAGNSVFMNFGCVILDYTPQDLSWRSR